MRVGAHVCAASITQRAVCTVRVRAVDLRRRKEDAPKKIG